jgi:hypothetical protein
MQKAAHIYLPSLVSRASSEKSENSEFDAIVLFLGIGVLAFLIAIITGVQGVWF